MGRRHTEQFRLKGREGELERHRGQVCATLGGDGHPEQMLRLTPGQRINRAAELWEDVRQLAVTTEGAGRRNKVSRPLARGPDRE